MGLEKICKSYLLTENSFEYENLKDDEAKEKVDSIARKWRHNLERMINNIKESMGNQTIKNILLLIKN